MELERALDLLRPDLDLARYVRLLERFYGFYEPWERSAGDSDWLEDRRKTPLLRSDLLYFEREPSALALCPELPGGGTAAEMAGVMYVLEGSTLGGQLLAKHFARTLSVRPGEGGSFFAGYGARTGAMWQAFRERAEREGDAHRSIAPALQTFDILHRWLAA